LDLDFLEIPAILLDPFNGLGQCITECLSQYRHAGFADGRQTLQSPRMRTTLPQLTHQDAVRQEDHVQVPGLALTASKLTIAHAQMLLAVPMEALRACPTVSIDPQNPCYFPVRTIRYQDLLGLLVLTLGPQDHQSNFVSYARNPHTLGKGPLSRAVDVDFLAVSRHNLGGKVLGLDLAARHQQLAGEGQSADVVTSQAVDMIEIVLVCEPTVEREIPDDLISNGPIDQLTKQHIVIAKLDSLLLTLLAFDEGIELKGIVFLRGDDVIDDQVVMCDLVPLLGVIPEIAYVLDKLTGVIDQDVVDGDDAVVDETGFGGFPAAKRCVGG